MDKIFFWKTIKPWLSDKLVVKVRVHSDGKDKLSKYELHKGFNTK